MLKLRLLDQILDVAHRLRVGILVLIQQQVVEQRVLAQLRSASQSLQKLLWIEELVLSLTGLIEDLGSLQQLSEEALK